MTDTDLASLAERFGTPLYIFDARRIRNRIEMLKDELPRDCDLCFAIKANPFVVPEVAPLVERLEVCSPGELRICDACHMPAGKLVISGVHKDAALMHELAARQDLPHRCTVESLAQLELLNDATMAAGRRTPVLLRLSSGNQFGIDAGTVRDIIARRDKYPHLDFAGIQFFSGTQKRRARQLERELSRLDAFIAELAEAHGWQARELEYGPGLPVAYFADDAVDEPALLASLRSSLEGMRFARRVILELGRSLVAGCGTFLTRVVDAKSSGNNRFAIVDGGIHHLVYYGQAMALHQPPCHLVGAAEVPASTDAPSATRAGNHDANATGAAPWTVCGSLCSVNDILLREWEAPALSIGSLLAFERAGAYCMTEGIGLFLSRDLPGVAVIDESGAARLVRASTPTHPLNTPQY